MNACSLFARGCVLLAVLLLPAWCSAAKPAAKPTSPVSPSELETVDLFDAIDAGQVEVKFIAKSEKQGRVRITNKTQKPLNVRLPEAFAARPVLAQFGPLARNAGGQNDPPQSLGSTFNGGANNGNNPNVGGPNFFNVPAEKTGTLRVACVCLDYGKPTPRPSMVYELVRLETVSHNPSLAALLAKLNTTNQDEVQAAAWHVANDMTWEELALMRIEHLVEPNEPFFTVGQLKRAKDLVGEAARASDETLAQQ